MKIKAKSYAEALERLLNEVEMKPRALALASGVAESQISFILSGKRNPNVETIEKLLRAAGKSWLWLDENMAPIADRPADDGPPADAKGRPMKEAAEEKPVAKKKGKK